MYEQKYDDRLLVERVLKAKDQTTMLRGLQYFVQEKSKQVKSFLERNNRKE